MIQLIDMYISLRDKSASMASLMKLIKGIIFAALLRNAARGNLTSTLIRSVSRILRPSTILAAGAFIASLMRHTSSQPADRPKNFQTLLESTLASMLLRATKGSGVTFTEAEAASTINAILFALLRSIEGLPSEGRQYDKNRIIESSDYSVAYEK